MTTRTLLVPCPGCDTRYDVGRREPGKKVRCPRCKAVLVVPEAAPAADEDELLGTSSRLRRARGPVCRWHPKRSATERCDGCQSWACADCWGPPPVDHVCRGCAEARGLEGAIAVDFGPLATPRVALAALGRALPKILVWNLASVLATFTVFGIPLALGFYAWRAAQDGSALREAAAAVVLASGMAMLIVHYLLVVPSGCATFLDQAIRGASVPFGEAFRIGWRRVLQNAPALVGVALTIFVVLLPFLVAIVGGAWLAYDRGAQAVAALILLIAPPLVFFPVVSAFGLAVPVVVLEERSATAALGRAWELVRPQLLVVCGLVVGFFVAQGVLTTTFAALTDALGLPRPLMLFASYLTDLVWPALLVAAYHGLSAEQVGVPGRK